jgi:hypothetical protein
VRLVFGIGMNTDGNSQRRVHGDGGAFEVDDDRNLRSNVDPRFAMTRPSTELKQSEKARSALTASQI